MSGSTPGVDERLAFLDRFLPLVVLELSHLAGSVIGLGLMILARALFRRVQAAYHISFWLLVAGIAASLLKGLAFEQAMVLALVLGVLTLGRGSFYRPTAIFSERFTPVWIACIAGVTIERGVVTAFSDVKDGVTEDEFVEMRTARDNKLGTPKLIIPSIQVNMNAGNFPAPDKEGNVFLKNGADTGPLRVAVAHHEAVVADAQEQVHEGLAVVALNIGGSLESVGGQGHRLISCVSSLGAMATAFASP